MDGFGLKIYGEGEWKVRTHGKSRRRTWRSYMWALTRKAVKFKPPPLTTNSVSDDQMVEPLLAQIKQPIDRFAGDGSYD